VEGQGFYGFNLSEVLPYVVTRTWHTQLAVLWIATAWLATGLYIAPAISGHEPKFQRLGVNFLFVCLLVIVAGSMLGQWLGVMQKLGLDINFWFGHQGWEYVDLGRFWQIFLFVGLMLWLTLVGRALWPALKKKDEGRPLVILLFLSTVAIGLFYGAGLMWGKHTHLAIVEYWRWWVVHLWVEGFFEVFATAVIAFLFTKLGLVRTTSAVTAVLFATIVFLTGGVLGTFHHLYFTGTPTAVLAIGAAFSALEVVPLVLIGFEAYENWKASQHRGWVATYKWPIMFFISVAFWNLVGAGLFGFLINPPLALYYMQGLNTTPLHGHTALFGVYGMLGIGLMLFCLRGLTYRQAWNEKLLKLSFWSLNLGLAAMAVFSLLPLGLMQVWASVTEGFWYARSAEFLQQPLMQALVWLRVPGDVLFSVGVVALAWFVFRLFVGPRETVPARPLAGCRGLSPRSSPRRPAAGRAPAPRLDESSIMTGFEDALAHADRRAAPDVLRHRPGWLLAWSGWWAAVLAARAAGLAGLEPARPALLLHGAAMLYLVLPPFMYGFLLTVFPRWMPAPQPSRAPMLAAFGLLNARQPAVPGRLAYGPALLTAAGCWQPRPSRWSSCTRCSASCGAPGAGGARLRRAGGAGAGLLGMLLFAGTLASAAISRPGRWCAGSACGASCWWCTSASATA
jgi:hypothetical protein